LVRADEFQFDFLLLTSASYFQLGSGSGLDVIKYPTCSNTCPLGVIPYIQKPKVNFCSKRNDEFLHASNITRIK
ncbi:MAG: hypothetical protein ACKVOW_07495, partial [Chitinophagaceae bacterium]